MVVCDRQLLLHRRYTDCQIPISSPRSTWNKSINTYNFPTPISSLKKIKPCAEQLVAFDTTRARQTLKLLRPTRLVEQASNLLVPWQWPFLRLYSTKRLEARKMGNARASSITGLVSQWVDGIWKLIGSPWGMVKREPHFQVARDSADSYWRGPKGFGKGGYCWHRRGCGPEPCVSPAGLD